MDVTGNDGADQIFPFHLVPDPVASYFEFGFAFTIGDDRRILDLLTRVEPVLELEIFDLHLSPDLAGGEVLGVDVDISIAVDDC